MTVACARCHDHKFDAISTKDYYALFGLLEGSSGRLVRFDSRETNRDLAEKLAALRRCRESALRRALAAGLRPTADRFADLLRAAAAVRTGIQPEAAAQSFQVEPAAVEAWVEELKAAAKDERHPLHAWAALADAKDFPARRKELLAAVGRRTAAASHALNGAQVVADYRQLRPDGWYSDDVTFGPGPVPLGGLLYAADTGRPVRGIATMTAARFDPVWANIADAKGSEQEAGDLAYPRAGRSLRTRSFVVERPKLYSLVRGVGRVFASVDEYTMIEGPLHRSLVKKVSGDKWTWVEHESDAVPRRTRPRRIYGRRQRRFCRRDGRASRPAAGDD